MHILDEIVEKRKEDIKKYGYTFGVAVPEKRLRGITPFLLKKGAVLEVKRASPSKGDIAPGLDAAKTAETYAEAGAAAISVLTEKRYFKGDLNDLMAVCRSVDLYAVRTGKIAPCVLRKDFILCPEEIDVAYRCGADVVLLIARILDDDMLLEMVKKCRTLGISALLELRLDDDLRKLALIAEKAGTDNLVCGVNSRDLSTFAIDLLTPAGILDEIRHIAGKDVRVIFESGIRTPKAAAFAGSMGFSGMLLGEAAARNPGEAAALTAAFVNAATSQNAQRWLSFAKAVRAKKHLSGGEKKPFVKICGLTSASDALNAAECGADFLGFIFCAKSPRNVSAETVREIKKALLERAEQSGGKDVRPLPVLVAVITECNSAEGRAAISLAKEGTVDIIQLHGKTASNEFFEEEAFSSLPHYVAVNVSTEDDLDKIDELRKIGEPRILVDAQFAGKIGGTGMQVQGSLCTAVSKKIKLWLAGGISAENVRQIVQDYEPELIDINSGIESVPGKKDVQKMKALFGQLQ